MYINKEQRLGMLTFLEFYTYMVRNVWVYVGFGLGWGSLKFTHGWCYAVGGFGDFNVL